MKGSALIAVALSVLAVADAVGGGLRPGQNGRNLQSNTNVQEVYFSEMMAEDESVLILEDGPIKFTASCKTVTYDYDYYSSSSSYSNTPSSYGSSSYSSSTPYSSSRSYSSSSSSHMSPSYSSSHYYPTSSCYDPCGTMTSSGGGSYSYGYDDDHMTDDYMSDDYYSYDYSYTESIAALELTYTAIGADYLYGSPSYANYPNETVLVGGYEAGESRTQTVFAGRDGGYGDMSTLQSMSGYYVSINGDSTIGIHKEWTEYLPGGTENFPEGVECMMAGFITYVTPGSS